MTIMFAGGMTIAIPGETPVAVAQTGMLSVSATAAPGNSFGGPQIIEIVVDDPTRSETGDNTPDVTIDDNQVTMTQADTGKWYAYVASKSLNTAAAADPTLGFNLEEVTDGDNPNDYTSTDLLASAARTPGTDGAAITLIQTFAFDDDSDIDVELGTETITLHYEEDLDGLATVSVDRIEVPVDGEVHVTVSDFRLNLDPTGEDVWIVQTDGNLTSLVFGADDNNDDDWLGTFGGDGGVFTVTEDIRIVTVTDGSVGLVTLTETGANTGVFESQNADDSSNIDVTGVENDDFTIAYADDDVQVFIEEFDSTLELIADGTWDSGETATVRLTDENLNLNTLLDDHLTKDSDNLPVMRFGTPMTLRSFNAVPAITDDSASVDGKTLLTTLSATSQETVFDITLTDDQVSLLNSTSMSHYVHYYDGPDLTTKGIQLLDTTTDNPLETIEAGLTKIPPLATDADGEFTLTFDTSDLINEGNQTANAALRAAADAINDDDDEDTAASVATALEALDDNDESTDVSTIESELNAIKTAVNGLTDIPQATQDKITNDIPITVDGEDPVTTGPDEDQTARNNFKTASVLLRDITNTLEGDIVSAQTTFALDIFTFGADANNAIYRALLEETDSGSGVFEATIEYQVLNQRTVDSENTHKKAVSIDDELVMILNTEQTGGDAPEFTYDEDNASKDAPTNTGEVSVDASTYRVSDDVTITLVDADLNTDSGAREVYRIADNDGTFAPPLVSIMIGDSECADQLEIVSLRETANDSGIFEGSIEVPAECGGSMTTGESITVTYTDFRDETGGDSEWTDSATIGADTGSVSLDRTVYPVPPGDEVTITVAVDDSDVDTSSSSTQTIETGVELTVAGVIVELDPLKETEPDSGIFDASVTVGTSVSGKDANDPDEDKTVRIEQGDIITVRYTDESDASGNENSVSDSATFDLRNAVLTSDKSVYVIGQDALLTLIEADLNLDSGTIDNIDLDRINWDSEAYDGSLDAVRADLGPVPTNLRETGENTGIFQVVITISDSIDNNALERGEQITLAYLDRGPSGADYVGDDERDVELQIETSNFGATVELDQNVYTWTDKVFITVVASDYNFDSNIVDEIGTEDKGEITIRTRADELGYRLAETGPDTGVFTGELVLTGDADALSDGGPTGRTSDSSPAGPTDGLIKTRTSDGISISFDYSDSEAPLVASALIRWNVGEVQWLEASYAATGSGVVRIIDPDMNINPDAVDSIDAVVYSETFIGGIELTLTETQEASGIFEGTVEFDPESASDGHRLQVTEGDIVTAEYEDETLPKPDNGDTLEITATTLIGSIVPPLERAPASNPAIVDAFGNSLASVSVDQQVQITADLTSGQDRDQDFAFLVQIQNEDGVTVELSWIAGTLGGGATFNAAQSWTPSETGSYTATIFVWESVSNPTALSPQLSITIDVV